jgi:two-component system OmpR family sensor kinase
MITDAAPGTPEPLTPWVGVPVPAVPPAPPAPPGRSRSERIRHRFLPHTLAGRLVAFVLALVLIVVCASGAVTYIALRAFLVQRLDQQLQTTVDSLPQIQASETTQTSPFEAPQRIWISVTDLSGNLLSTGVSANREWLSTPERQALLRDLNAPRNLSTLDGVSVRAMATKVQLQANGQTVGTGYAFVGLSTDDLNGTLTHLLLLELLIGAGVALLASGLTTLGVRAGLRPLYRVTRTARAVAAELSPEGTGLDRRVPAGDPESEVGQLAESVNTLLEAVESQFAARRANEDRMRQFLADASHELRTPLTSIRGYAELARLQRRAGATADPDGDKDVLDRIEAEGTRMSRMVDDLLMLARSDRGVQLQFSPVEVDGLVDDVVSGARAAHPGRPIVADVEQFVLEADRDQLLRVLRNLVTNAAVHTAVGGVIRLRARAEGEWAVFSVIDSGPGLDPQQTAHVFERFWRADKARVRARGGTGLGLAIVASVIQAHGGTVRFDSTVEAGTTVTVTLPLAAAPPDLEDDPNADE